jgi:hypothetical protein
MRSFRFPLWTIVLMVTVLVVTITAIEAARIVSIQLVSGNAVHSGWWALVGLFALVTALMCGVSWIGYGVLHLLRRTGVQRFSSVATGRHGK